MVNFIKQNNFLPQTSLTMFYLWKITHLKHYTDSCLSSKIQVKIYCFFFFSFKIRSSKWNWNSEYCIFLIYLLHIWKPSTGLPLIYPCMSMFYNTHRCPCPIHPPLSTWLNNAGLHTSPRPREINGFCSPKGKWTLYNRKPKWFGPDTVDSLDQRGPWEESSVLLEGRTLGTKERQEETKNQ